MFEIQTWKSFENAFRDIAEASDQRERSASEPTSERFSFDASLLLRYFQIGFIVVFTGRRDANIGLSDHARVRVLGHARISGGVVDFGAVDHETGAR